jgi:hypothetical protein
MMIDPSSAARSALTTLFTGGRPYEQRSLDQMTLAELEAEDKLSDQRLQLARQLGLVGGFGLGVTGVLGVKKLLK